MRAFILCGVLSVALALGCGEAKEEKAKKEGAKKEAPKKEGKTSEEGKEDSKLKVQVKAGPVEVDEVEGFSREAVEEILRGKTKKIQGCYLNWVQENDGKEGTVLLGVTIDTGGVAEVEVVENGFDDDVVATCASGIVKATSFPKPAKKTTLRVPFKFRSH